MTDEEFEALEIADGYQLLREVLEHLFEEKMATAIRRDDGQVGVMLTPEGKAYYRAHLAN
jgi:hypothetical protein